MAAAAITLTAVIVPVQNSGAGSRLQSLADKARTNAPTKAQPANSKTTHSKPGADPATAVPVSKPGPAPIIKSEAADASEPNAQTSRGVVHPRHEATLANSVTARIKKMPFREGDRFKSGDLLIRFDCRRAKAELRAARAAHDAEDRNSKMQAELLRLKATGKADAKIAEARASEQKAKAKVIEHQVRECEIRAPFNGRIAEQFVNEFESPPANSPLLRVVSDRDLELHLVVSSRWLAWMQDGTRFEFHVDETGRKHSARIKRIAATVDAVSQTVRIVGIFDQSVTGVLPGMSGEARFDLTNSTDSTDSKPAQGNKKGGG